MTHKQRFVVCVALSLAASVLAEEPRKLSLPKAQSPDVDAAHAEKAGTLINNAVNYLLSAREEDGGWSLGRGANKPAITAMVLKVLLQHPDFTVESPEVRKGFEVLLSFRQKDGGIYDPKQGVQNYTTSLAVMAFASAGDKYKDAMRGAVAYLKGQQIVAGATAPDGAKIDEKHPFVGGVSYGEHGRPDLSNVGMWMEALQEAGVPSTDESVQRALVFVTRTQNRSESNPMAWAKEGGDDGGFVYAPAISGKPDGESKAGAGPDQRGLRSYGSMTYVGFKSLLYAGLAHDDPRVRAAYDWIRRYWRLDSNPNMPEAQSRQGLFYYYNAFAKALRAWGEPMIADAKDQKHNWRQELIDVLASKVASNGSWSNDASRWEEANPLLATCYATFALQEALKK